MLICLQNFLNDSDVKFMPASEIIFLGSPYFAYIILVHLNQVVHCKVAHLLQNREHVTVVYSAQKFFIVNHEDVTTDHFPWSAWYFIR